MKTVCFRNEQLLEAAFSYYVTARDVMIVMELNSPSIVWGKI
jgi:hypothetical protein